MPHNNDTDKIIICAGGSAALAAETVAIAAAEEGAYPGIAQKARRAQRLMNEIKEAVERGGE